VAAHVDSSSTHADNHELAEVATLELSAMVVAMSSFRSGGHKLAVGSSFSCSGDSSEPLPQRRIRPSSSRGKDDECNARETAEANNHHLTQPAFSKVGGLDPNKAPSSLAPRQAPFSTSSTQPS
jgi:hypothetical protein